MIITAAILLTPAVLVGLGALVVAWFNKAHKRRRRMALLNKAQGLGR